MADYYDVPAPTPAVTERHFKATSLKRFIKTKLSNSHNDNNDSTINTNNNLQETQTTDSKRSATTLKGIGKYLPTSVRNSSSAHARQSTNESRRVDDEARDNRRMRRTVSDDNRSADPEQQYDSCFSLDVSASIYGNAGETFPEAGEEEAMKISTLIDDSLEGEQEQLPTIPPRSSRTSVHLSREPPSDDQVQPVAGFEGQAAGSISPQDWLNSIQNGLLQQSELRTFEEKDIHIPSTPRNHQMVQGNPHRVMPDAASSNLAHSSFNTQQTTSWHEADSGWKIPPQQPQLPPRIPRRVAATARYPWDEVRTSACDSAPDADRFLGPARTTPAPGLVYAPGNRVYRLRPVPPNAGKPPRKPPKPPIVQLFWVASFEP